MIKTLVSLHTGLASRIALRYACKLDSVIDMELHTVYVREPDAGEHSPPGTGWVHKTWEEALMHSEKEDIQRLIESERASCPGLGIPKISIGDREKEIYYELQNGFYDLFVEGMLHTFNASVFYQKIHSWFYRNSPCPIILVKNLVSLEKVVIVLCSSVNYAKLISTFLKYFKGVKVEPDLIYCHFNGKEKTAPSNTEDPEVILQNARKILSEHNMMPGKCSVVQNSASETGDFLRGYGLVVSSIYRQSSKRSQLLKLLSHTPYPLFLCWQ